MRETRNAKTILVWEPHGIFHLDKCEEDNIVKTALGKIQCEVQKWVELKQYYVQLQVFALEVLKLSILLLQCWLIYDLHQINNSI
jgi:hypothetical protein